MSEANEREIMFWLRPKAAPRGSWLYTTLVLVILCLKQGLVRPAKPAAQTSPVDSRLDLFEGATRCGCLDKMRCILKIHKTNNK